MCIASLIISMYITPYDNILQHNALHEKWTFKQYGNKTNKKKSLLKHRSNNKMLTDFLIASDGDSSWF